MIMALLLRTKLTIFARQTQTILLSKKGNKVLNLKTLKADLSF